MLATTTYNLPMSFPLKLAHSRYTQQARWTGELRSHLFADAGIASAQRILDVGCGTGAVLGTIIHGPRTELHGLDIDIAALAWAKSEDKDAHFGCGDAHHLPYRRATFDIVFFHFVLLWLRHAEIAVSEARRVTKPGGVVIAFAEPDYGGRIDHPNGFSRLAEWQKEALQARGADPCIGRRIREVFHDADLHNVQSGVLGAEWSDAQASEERELEWEMMERDLAGRLDPDELARYRKLDTYSRNVGERVLYVPTFFAWAKVN